MNEAKVKNWLEREIKLAEIELEKNEKSLVNVILNCGKDDIAVDEYTHTIKYYRNRIVELKELINS